MPLQPNSTSKNSHTAVNVVLDTAYQGVDAPTWAHLFADARQSKLEEFIADLFAGKHINVSENRPALHSALRNLHQTPVLIDGKDVMPAVAAVWSRI